MLAQPILDFIWNEWSKNAKWPRVRVIDHKFGKEKSEQSMSVLNDAYLLQCDPSHDPTYELRLFGLLSTSLGDQWLNLLSRFVEFLTTAFNADPGREHGFKSDEIAVDLSLSKSETVELGRILSFHVFDMMNVGYSPGFTQWECGIPKGFADIAEPGDPRQKLERILAHRYQPRFSVRIEERQRELAKMAIESAQTDALLGLAEPQFNDNDGPAFETECSIEVFLSHSAKDKDLAGAMIQLLTAALSIPRDKIRCTSVDGSKLPLAADTDTHIRSEIRGSKVFVALLTPASLRSVYVLFELGARWGGNRFLAGLFSKGASGSSLTGPISRINVLNAHNEADLHQFIGDIADRLNVRLPNAGAFLKELKQVCDTSRAGDPFVRFEGKRVKARGPHKKEQYFVHQGRTHYLEVDAAEVCETEKIPYTSVEAEDMEVLLTTVDDALNALQMRSILSVCRERPVPQG
jgi:hypothetical protein